MASGERQMQEHKVAYLLRLADNDMILSQRLSEWCGKGPALEEDMALTNVALDLIGQARFWYSYAGELEGQGRDEDQLAFLRDANAYVNVLLVEQPNGNYAQTLARQFYFDVWHFLVLQALTTAADERVAAIAEKSLKEVAYHLRRSVDLVIRLGDGTDVSHRMMQEALDDLWMFTGELFNADEVDLAMQQAGIAPDLTQIRQSWLTHVASVLKDATLTLPSEKAWMQKGGKQGVHSEHLGFVLAEMQFLQRAYPQSAW
jgi:ring-1,2-phenylacetyl-CoA epoxidase subunit PaaC